jgi:hypothetical protein
VTSVIFVVVNVVIVVVGGVIRYYVF